MKKVIFRKTDFGSFIASFRSKYVIYAIFEFSKVNFPDMNRSDHFPYVTIFGQNRDKVKLCQRGQSG